MPPPPTLTPQDQWLAHPSIGVPVASYPPAPAAGGSKAPDAPAPVCKGGSDKQSQEFQAAFQAQYNAINGHLAYTALNAELALHKELAARRDALPSAFESAIGQVDPDDPKKAKGAIDNVLGTAKALNGEVAKFRATTEKSLKAWQAVSGAFDKAVQRLQELEAWGVFEELTNLRKLADPVQQDVNERKWDGALTAFKQFLASLNPVYEKYQKQLAAKAPFDKAWSPLKPRLEKALAGQSGNEDIKAAQWEISNARLDMENAAAKKDYVSAKERLDKLPASLDKLDAMVKELRTRYEKAWSELQKELPKTSEKGSPKEVELLQQLNELCKKVEATAASGDYDSALKQIDDVRAKLAELKAEHEAYEKRKKDFETRFAGMKQALDLALDTKTDVKEVKATQDAVKAKKADAEKVAAAGDYATGMTRLDELDVALKAYQAELRKSPHSCDWVIAAAQELSTLIDIRYLQANNKIISAATAYDAALAQHKAALQKVAAAKELAASIAVGIFFAGLGGAVGGAAAASIGAKLTKDFTNAVAKAAVVDATKDVAKWIARTYDKYGGKGGDPTAGLPSVGGNGTELARKVGAAVNAQGIALKMEVLKMARFVKANEAQCKAGDVRVEETPSAVLDSDPFLKVLGTLADASQKVFAQLLWGEWINTYAFDTAMICSRVGCRYTVDDNAEGVFAWWGDLRKNIQEQAGQDFGLQARLDAARAEVEKKAAEKNAKAGPRGI